MDLTEKLSQNRVDDSDVVLAGSFGGSDFRRSMREKQNGYSSRSFAFYWARANAREREAVTKEGAGKKKATVSDVAEAVGVSIATVSRALNIPASVRDDLRADVLRAAASLGYSPNPAAKALRTQRTNIFGVAIPTLDYGFFAKIVNSFQKRLSQSGHSALVATTGFDNGFMFDKVRSLVEAGAQALLTAGKIEDEALRAYLAEKRIPVVTTYSYLQDDRIPSVGFDNYAATKVVLDYLLRIGHENIVMVAAQTKGNDRQNSRARCFRETMASAGLAKRSTVMEKDYAFVLEDGIDAMRRIYRDFPDTTAVVCNSDVFAFGVLAECRKLRIRVPDDLSVTGFDDLDFARFLDPSLTTIAVPASEMGSIAADLLVDATRNGRPISSVCLDADLIVRSSTGYPSVSRLDGPPSKRSIALKASRAPRWR
jgi:LacI family transcriptional regulator